MNDNHKIKENYLGKILWITTLILFASLIISIIRYPYLSIDGAFTKGLVLLPFWDLINVTAIDVHPPLYYLGLKAMIELFSIFNINNVYIIEFYSVIPYIIILFISYTKIKKEYGMLTSGIFSLTLISMSIFFSFYTMARMYSWAMLFVLLTFIVAKDILKNSTYKSWILLSIFSIFCAYTHYYAAIAVIILYALLLLNIIKNKSKPNFKKELKKITISIIFSIILFTPWIFTLFNQVSTVQQGYWISQIDLELLITCLSNWFLSTSNFTIELISIMALIFFFAYVIENYMTYKELDDYYVLLGTLIFFGTILLSIIISLTFKPILVLRYLLPVFSILWLCISIKIGNLNKHELKIGKFNSQNILTIIIIILIILSASNVMTQINAQEHSHNRFNDENQVYESINNNDSIILYDDLPRSVRVYYRFDDTFQQYGNFSMNNKIHSLDYQPPYINNNSLFNIPQDNQKFAHKDVYIVTNHNLTNETNIQFEQLENVRNAPKIFKVMPLSNNEELNLNQTDTDMTRLSADLQITANNITVGEPLLITVKSNSNLERRLNISIDDQSELIGLNNGFATVEFTDLEPGMHVLTVSYKGDSNYEPTTNTTNIEVKEKFSLF